MSKSKTKQKQPLNRPRILEAALRLVDREGLEALSMRKLGAELGVEAMSLYNHVKDKEALLDGIVEWMVSQVQPPAIPAAAWADELAALFRAYRDVLRAHPAVLPLIATRPLNTVAALAGAEYVFAILSRAGFSDKQAIYALNCLSGYVVGHALLDFGTPPLGTQPLANSLERFDMKHLSPDAFPYILKFAPALLQRSPDEEFEFGLAALIRGLKSNE